MELMEKTMSISHVPDSIIEAVRKVERRYGKGATTAFYSADGEAIVHYRTEPGSGVGMIHFVASGHDDGWVLCLHTSPGYVVPGLPDRFNANVMYDTSKDWWPKP